MAEEGPPTPAAAAEAAECVLPHLPHDVWVGVASGLGVRDLGRVAPTCRILAEEASDPEFWFYLFVRSCWPPSPALLAFAEGAGRDAASVAWRDRFRIRTEAPPAIVVDVGRGYAKFGIAHGVLGRPEGDGAAPQLVQLCSSATHPPDCNRSELLPYIQHRLDQALMGAVMDPAHPLRRVAVGGAAPFTSGGLAVLTGLVSKPHLNGCTVTLQDFNEERGRWPCVVAQPRCGSELAIKQAEAALASVPNGLSVEPKNLLAIRRARELPLVLGEPFAVTAERGRGGGAGGPSVAADATSWALGQLQQLGAGRPGGVHVVPQAQMSLWAHGVDHGIVVNIGQGQTIALPVVDGVIGASAARCVDLASQQLTSAMVQLLGQRFDWMDFQHSTYCRDLKEAHCYVAPPAQEGHESFTLQARLAAGHDCGVRSVLVESPDAEHPAFELSTERVLVPEYLFDGRMGGRVSIQMIIVQCAAAALEAGLCDAEGARRMLRQLVLVGGAADIPGMRPRTEHEVRALLRGGRAPERLLEVVEDCEQVFVLNPPLVSASQPLTTPRFVPFVGGCVRAASSMRLAAMCPEAARTASARSERALQSRFMSGAIGRAPGLAAWARRQLFNLDGPAIFRTGGGGGEDDDIWGPLHDMAEPSASEEEEEEEDQMEDAEEEAAEGEEEEKKSEEYERFVTPPDQEEQPDDQQEDAKAEEEAMVGESHAETGREDSDAKAAGPTAARSSGSVSGVAAALLAQEGECCPLSKEKACSGDKEPPAQ